LLKTCLLKSEPESQNFTAQWWLDERRRQENKRPRSLGYGSYCARLSQRDLGASVRVGLAKPGEVAALEARLSEKARLQLSSKVQCCVRDASQRALVPSAACHPMAETRV